jgi:two-component system, chemotaxis family, sensor kinase CheA
LRLRGKLLPIVHLADVLGLKRTYHSHIVRILVLKIGSKRFGIAVDAIHGSEETLVKSLPTFLKGCKCYSGVTILGDGKAAMILDTEGIITKAGLRFMDDQIDSGEREFSEADESIREQQNLLLFKCSGPETFGIDLSMVSRVEEIKPEDIECVGDKEFIKFRGQSLRVIRPEDFLPVKKNSGSSNRLFVIIPKLVKHPIGIIIQKIEDTLQSSLKLNEEDIKSKGIIGSVILHNRIVLLLNIYELFEKADPEHWRAVK